MEKSDYIIDIGPKAGKSGGEIIFEGNYKKMIKADTLTANYLSGKLKINIPKKRRKGLGKSLKLMGCSGNNLKSIDVEFPIGLIIGITGVSGSGKSTLINETLYPILNNHFYNHNCFD